MRRNEQAPSATFVGLSKPTQLPQAQCLPVECSPVALRNNQSVVTVLHPQLIFFLNKEKSRNQTEFISIRARPLLESRQAYHFHKRRMVNLIIKQLRAEKT